MPPLLELGNYGYWVGAAGIVAFTVVFLVTVRWWSDWLGRIIASVLSATSGILVITTLRQMWPDMEGSIFVWRAIVFCLFGVAVWSSLATFAWAQFFAPRIKRRRQADHTHGGK